MSKQLKDLPPISERALALILVFGVIAALYALLFVVRIAMFFEK
jgi:uncharacterized protein YneF (UPF0154 family)